MTLLDQLQQLAPLAAQATKGPWTHWVESNTVFYGKAKKNRPGTYSPADLQICQTDKMNERLEGVEAHPIEDAAFIARARNVLTPENLALLLAALAPQWVPVADRLPKSMVWVLVVTQDINDDSIVREMYMIRMGINDAPAWVSKGEIDYDVTHWMPLPLPPTTPAAPLALFR